MILTPIDYPKLGIDDPNWRRYSPAEPKAWHAFWLECGGTAGQGVFLGEGDTDLSIEPHEFGEIVIVCIGGFPYVIYPDGAIQAVPCDLLGYSQLVNAEETMLFCNYGELAVIQAGGEVRYAPDLALDDLRVVGVSGDTIRLTGLKEFGTDLEDFSVKVSDLPMVTERMASDT